MLTKALIVTVGGLTLGGVLMGREVCSYARTGVKNVQQQLKAEVPLEFEIQRAREEVERIIPVVRKSIHIVAEEQVSIKQLQASIVKKQEQLDKQQTAILAMTEDLKGTQSKFRYAGLSYTRNDVEKDLTERFKRFKIAEETLKQEHEILRAKESALAASRETLDSMLSQKKTLEAEVARLDARVRTLAARKEVNGLSIDDSQLNRVKGILSSISNRLDVEDAVLAADGDLNGLIPVDRHDEIDPVNITEQVSNYFAETSDVKATSPDASDAVSESPEL